jgi:hypothetical protein
MESTLHFHLSLSAFPTLHPAYSSWDFNTKTQLTTCLLSPYRNPSLSLISIITIQGPRPSTQLTLPAGTHTSALTSLSASCTCLALTQTITKHREQPRPVKRSNGRNSPVIEFPAHLSPNSHARVSPHPPAIPPSAPPLSARILRITS